MTILKAENISKQYRLGSVGTGTLGDDLKRWWYKLRGKEDPFLLVGAVNNRTENANEDYVWALRDINFEVKQGEVLGIIGKNGAGKSTLLKLLSRVTSPTTGCIKTKGRIASLLEVGTGFHGELTGRENIFMNGAVLGMTKSEIKNKLDEIIEFSGCEKYIDTPVKRYSSGMTIRLGFAVAAHLEPEILVVDEVLAVGDAEFQKKAIGKMQDLSRGVGSTVLFVSHNMVSVKNLCSRGILLENGIIVSEGKIDNVVNEYLTQARKVPRNENIISDRNRRFNTTKEVELEKVILEGLVTTRNSISLKIHLKRNKIIDSELCITGTICSYSDVEIGSFFSPIFYASKEDILVELTLPNHNLSVGEYYFNFSISKGSIVNSNLVALDHAYEAIGFEIFNENEDKDYLIKWNNSWGELFFDSKISVL